MRIAWCKVADPRQIPSVMLIGARKFAKDKHKQHDFRQSFIDGILISFRERTISRLPLGGRKVRDRCYNSYGIKIIRFSLNSLVSYSQPFFITRDSLLIQFMNTFLATIFGISKQIYRIAKIRSSLLVNDVPRNFSFRGPKRKKSLGAKSKLADGRDTLWAFADSIFSEEGREL
jgi:hypothetical protein